jgi:ABC-2 type transport system ATP-binding protein
VDAIEVSHLTRNYGSTKAVDDLSFSIRQGEIFGIVGPNGAGKTTLVNMLNTLLIPTAGQVRILGIDLQEPKKIREHISALFQEIILDDELTGRDVLDIHARLYHVPVAERKERITLLLSLLKLEDVADKKIETYSGGMKRKLELARCFLARPQILFLDEPTLGLDPQARRIIWEYIQKMNTEEHTTIVLTTHYLEEADELCHRVGIIHKGRFVKIGTPQQLKNTLRGDIIEISATVQGNILSKVKNIKGIQDAEIVKGKLRIYVAQGEKFLPKLIPLLSKRMKLKSIMLKKPSLEDVFLHYTGEEFT